MVGNPPYSVKSYVGQRRYLTESELGISVDGSQAAGGRPSAERSEVAKKSLSGRKYLSPEELLKEIGASASADTAPQQTSSVIAPATVDERVSSEDLHKTRFPRVTRRSPADETSLTPLTTTSEPTEPPSPTVAPASESAVSAPFSATPFVHTGISPENSQNRKALATLLELSPMSAEVLQHLESRLPETLNTCGNRVSQAVVQQLREDGAYFIGAQIARGAESLLYQGESGGYNFLVKSIRNWRDHWLGDSRTRKDTGKLSENVAYDTKLRHLTNEWTIGQQLREDVVPGAPAPIPVQLYSMRQVTSLGLELGWDLLMERINGIDLSDKRLLSVMNLSDKVRVCIRMAQAINVLHQKHFIHLDIKPSNFMLDRSGNIRLIDFGISVPTGTQSRTVAGTAGYFSPEQIACRPLGEETDIFALGVTFSVLFGGKVLLQTPEDAKSRQYRHDALADLDKNTLPAVTDIPELAGAAFKPLAEVIRACTVFRRVNRIGNCMALVNRLRQAAGECAIAL